MIYHLLVHVGWWAIPLASVMVIGGVVWYAICQVSGDSDD